MHRLSNRSFVEGRPGHLPRCHVLIEAVVPLYLVRWLWRMLTFLLFVSFFLFPTFVVRRWDGRVGVGKGGRLSLVLGLFLFCS